MEDTRKDKDRLSKEAAYPLIEEYYSNGELPSVFYRRVELNDNQFYGWRKKYLRDHPSLAKKLGVDAAGKSPRNASYKLSTRQTSKFTTASASCNRVSDSGFARIDVFGPTKTCGPLTVASGYELCYPNGVVLHLPMGIGTSTVSELVKLYLRQ